VEQHKVIVRGRQFLTQKGRYDRFWNRVNQGNWEPETYAVFEEYIDQDTLLVDFGAWIGPTALFGAQLAHQCLAFEPDHRAFEELEANVALNKDQDWAKRIKVFEQAIHATGEPISINSSGEGGDSMSSALFPNRPTQWTVQTRRLGDVIKEHRGDAKKVFVKIDIEGGEYDLLPAVADLMAQEDIVFSVEFHHRMLFRSLKQTAEDNPDWQETYKAKMKEITEALPWGRKMLTNTGTVLDRDGVVALISGNGEADTIIMA
jgi:FkbM family methyltransferase